MDPLLSKEEKNMRDKVLQHEFPFDEKAWGAMKTLLEEKGEKPATGIPPAQQEPIPGPGKNLVWLILLFLSAGIGAASIFWPAGAGNNMPTTSILTPAETSKSLKTTIPATGAGAATEATQAGEPTTGNHNPTQYNQSGAAAFKPAAVPGKSKTANYTKAFAGKNQPISLPEPHTGLKSGGANTENAAVVGFTPKATTREPGLQAAALTPGELPKPSQESETLLPTNPQKQLEIFFLPLLQTPDLPLNSPLSIRDSLTRPVKVSPRAGKKREQGILLGMNANTVDYNPMRISMLPHIGYFQSFRLNSSTRLQADLVLKYVTGYQLYVESRDITPLGASYSTLSTNSLVYLEMPVILKRQFRGNHSFFTGVKPSLNYKIFSSGQNAGFNMDNTREYTSQSGIRYFDFGLVLGWEYRIRPRWTLDARYNQGLLDLSYDQFYRDNSTHLNSDLQLSLRYIFGK